MAVERGLLLIADIAGYTRFMEFHRTDLAHAQDIVARLLEAMVDAATALRLVEVEGDAAFLYRPLRNGAGDALGEAVVRHARAMHRAFHARQQAMACLNTCPCQGCSQTQHLKVKFVAHVGDVAPQRVKRLTRLAGFDVIVVHRMLKNAVPISEYLLLSEPLFSACGEPIRRDARPLEQELESVGRAHYIDLTTAVEPLPARPPITPSAQRRETWGVLVRTLPYVLGLRKPCLGFRNLTPA